jgi:predicted RNA binding protein YcfA (HicA-like mRNA interferase family)
VGRYDELRVRILQGKADANIDFDDLCSLLRWLGFDERVRGSHHIFRRPGVQDRINLQYDGSKAKVYQVRQVRRVMLTHGLEGKP